MKELRLVGDDWPGSTVNIADSFLDNLRGISDVGDGRGVLLRKRALHTVGMKTPLWGIGVDSTGTVLVVKTMQPNRFFYFSASAYVVEVPLEMDPPVPGDRVRVVE